MKFRKIFLPAAIALAFLGAGCYKTTTNVSTTNTVLNANTTAKVYAVSYAGQEGKNALELLQASHQVDVSSAGFVNAIDGVKPGDHQFWAFYVNDQQAQVGAKDYQTTGHDNIGWKLESF